MIYNHKNVAPNCAIVDVERRQVFAKVMSVDTDLNEVEIAVEPLEFTASGDIAKRRIRFRSVRPIAGGKFLPCLFHCYERLQ